MSVSWTKEQKQVIENRGSNLLVSAAAGSGKTAVLVERIIRLVTEGEHPYDIDRLLVMTFTNAAAAEMRERIGAAIEKRLAECPDDEHLQIQATLVHHAQITTIDSFCLNLIRDYFNCLELDPSFRVGDEGEVSLLRADVMQELLEWNYENGGERFERFVGTYAQGKSDAGIEDYIDQVYTFAQSNPYPAQWFMQCREELAQGGDAAWKRFLLEDVHRQAAELADQLADALAVCEEDEYFCAYAPMLGADVRRMRTLAEADGERVLEVIAGITWDRLATVRKKEADPEKKAYITACRDRAKKAVAKMKELYCFASPEEMEADMAGCAEAVETLLSLAEDFAARFQEKKRERNIVDFNDLEHEALKVLIACEDGIPLVKDGGYVYTEAADELAQRYEEVLVDEYQDSNLVQEALLHAVSQERFGRPNVFMVGDVKQSIYKFRLARPELFLEKYHSYVPYGAEAGGGQEAGGRESGGQDIGSGNAGGRKIELHQNFRSRAEVLDGINDVFYRIMTENLGGICYTEETALHAGAAYEGEAAEPELLVVDTGEAALAQMDEEAADYTAREIEAKLIAARIRALTDPETGMMVWDKRLGDGGAFRRAQYRDMVILLRSTAGWTETFLSVLMNEGIPAYAESRTGYFNATEVETVLSLLSVIDNPMQDIPLAAVLKAPFVGVSDEELAQLMAAYRADAAKGQDRGIYAAVRRYVERGCGETDGQADAPGRAEAAAAWDGDDVPDALLVKLRRFEALLSGLRRESTYLPIHELLYRIYERTGYYRYVSAMPAGETRRANLDMLVEKAAAFGQTSYQGLFYFVRYIENLKKYNTDFGEASTVGEEDDTVRIMSIHKSKGLEFPVVFLAGMGKKFNKQDTYGKVLIDPELGIATDFLDPVHRLKAPTLKKNVLRRKMVLDSLGEELRVLYVAMTRAKERLIMTGTDRYLEKTMEKYAGTPLADGQIPYTVLAAAGSYLDWLLMSTAGGGVRVRVTQVPVADIVGEELVRQIRKRSQKERLLSLGDAGGDAEYRAQLARRLSAAYPYEADIHLHTEISVSELKKQGQHVDAAESVRQSGPLDFNWEAQLAAKGTPPADFSGPEAIFGDVAPDGGAGASRGTAYHRALELLPFDRMGSARDVQEYLEGLVEKRQYTRENLDLIDCGEIWRFLDSGLGRRMRQAQKEGRLHKEQQFVMGLPAAELYGEKGRYSDELVIIQGIIDAYLEEADGLVLVDYKTDRIRSPQTLLAHYGVQLEYYKKALEMMTGQKVKEKLIYSLTLQQEIRCR